ncbi:hypothetical protein HOU39_gp128 [Lactobacillus phage Iacchus]|uniref:Uncharacterized protein n=1 Tax=Lactobacillus phage Iacchus TaxID=2315483 RepID=A0A3Q8HXA6_9CAUD|nr:hypothetical protein HOU39_gp128 [Lactobacillus phage Iacchus]AYH92022.1 hypothetical protein [Lactobacillus phage Iacchus]AYH92194.1 hypothetical protein [Lactobacillus phage Dionysus]
MSLKDMVNKNDPLARKVLAYNESDEFKKELTNLAERVKLGLSQEEYRAYKKDNKSKES